jgi:hypothetical protein
VRILSKFQKSYVYPDRISVAHIESPYRALYSIAATQIPDTLVKMMHRRMLASAVLALFTTTFFGCDVAAFSVSTASKHPMTNTKLPMVDLHYGFPPQLVNVAQYAANKNMLILFLPGAFTPT